MPHSDDFFAPYADTAIKDRSVKSKTTSAVVDSVPPFQSEESNNRLGTPANQFSTRPLLIAAFFFLFLILTRVFYLQIIKGSEYRSRAEGNRIQTHIAKALRGVMYDHSGNLLVKNIPNFTLVVNTQEIANRKEEHIQEVARSIEAQTHLPYEQILEALHQSILNGQAMTIQDHIPYTDALRLMISSRSIPGLSIQTLYSREYLANDSYSHVLGYTAKITQEEYDEYEDDGYLLTDELGKSGLEKSYEEELRGRDGYQNVEVDFRGRQKNIVSDTKPESGHNIHLTIHSDLQNILYSELKNIIDEKKLPGGSAVAIDPRTGAVLALVSYPSYGNNLFAGGISQEEYSALQNDERNPLFFRPLSGQYPSGSVFKPVVAAAALEEHTITPDYTVVSTGGLEINGSTFPDWKGGGHGVTNVFKALAESVNTFFYLVGGGDNETTTGLGVERITAYASKFGLGQTTGIDVPGESDGFLPSKGWKEEFKNEPWYIGDTYHLAIGQGDILVTPLQVAIYTATIANGGTYYQPRVVERLTNQQGETTSTPEPVIKNQQVVSSETIDIVRRGMREAVISGSGSARSLQQLPVSSAGKTGTAQFGHSEKTHSWFTAFAPYDNPEIAITVMVEEAGGGNDAALPIARTALHEYFTTLQR